MYHCHDYGWYQRNSPAKQNVREQNSSSFGLRIEAKFRSDVDCAAHLETGQCHPYKASDEEVERDCADNF